MVRLTPAVCWKVAEQSVEATQRLHRLSVVQISLQCNWCHAQLVLGAVTLSALTASTLLC